MEKKVKIGNSLIGDKSPTYFIADIASNHDGSLLKAKKLIQLAAEAGANAAKFQNFTAETLVSNSAFSKIGNIAHQSDWKESTFDGYNKVSIPFEWTEELKLECKKNKIDYFTSPYNLDFINKLNPHVSAWKVGSGEISWHDSIKKMAETGKTIIIATGASELFEVTEVVRMVLKINENLVIMQCNTNYTGSKNNFKYINLNVLKTYSKLFPDILLGLSDHTTGHSTVLGAVAMGAKFIEKHFTDNNNLSGPDHKFSMSPLNWKNMVDATRELEDALGDGKKKVEQNEIETIIIQRRGIRANKLISKGKIIKEEDLIYLRPCDEKCLPPYKKNLIINRKAKIDINKDETINLENTE